jgi:hypothetical protein
MSQPAEQMPSIAMDAPENSPAPETSPVESIDLPDAGRSFASLISGKPDPVEASNPAQNASNDGSWRDTLPEDLKGNKVLDNVKDVPDAIRQLVNLQTLLGKKVEDFEAQDLAKFNAKLGVPQDPSQYKFVLKEGVQMDPAMESVLRDIAHKGGLSQAQANRVAEHYAEYNQSIIKEAETRNKDQERQALETLTGLWGSATNARLNLIGEGLRKVGGDEFFKAFNESGLGANPAALQAMLKVAELVSEDKGVDIKGSARYGVSPQDAQQMIDGKLSDPDFLNKYQDSRHPGHEAAFAEMERLFKLANPDDRQGA